ncbi:MAG: hypothetical protein KGD58_02650 [Candidatus Lokiarchaeota archaeon]|nr:hypothetical protein [Candidatus Lokiarchaeota archaeon]
MITEALDEENEVNHNYNINQMTRRESEYYRFVGKKREEKRVTRGDIFAK